MPTYQIPHTAHYFTSTNIFTATFNNPTAGQYDFGIDANKNQFVSDLQRNKYYLIDRMSVGGSISEADYLEAISTLPSSRLKRSIKKENVYFLPLSHATYTDDSDIIAWVKSEKKGDTLTLDFTGVLDQTAALVGTATIKIHITLSIYIISSTVFYRKLRGELSDQVGDQPSGVIGDPVTVQKTRQKLRQFR